MAESEELPSDGFDPIRGRIVRKSNGGIEAPKSIVQTPSSARTIYNKFRTEHLKRIQLYAQIEGLIAGNPPYNPAELAKHGLAHIANFNNLDGRSLYERGALAYWNLLNEAETICKFFIEGDDPQLVKFADIMAKNFDEVIRTWPSFYTQVNTLSGQLIKFGISPVLWPDERDFRWRTIELQRFFVSDQTLADIEQITAVCMESFFSVQYMYEVYTELSSGKIKEKDVGWNKKEIEALLLNRANTFSQQQYQIFDMMDLQRRIQNGDINFAQFFSDQLRLISLFYKEYDGKISHYIFDRTYDNGNFLYSVIGQYESFEEALVIFTASPGEFTLHSNRGLGHKILSGCQAMMQLDCSIIDAARWASTPLLKTIATGSKDFEAIRFYPGVPTNIGTAEFQQNNMGANISQLVSASQYVRQKLEFNTANSGDDPGVPDRNQGSISAVQAKMKSFKEFGVLKHNIAHFYNLFDIVLRNMVVKMLHCKQGYPGYEYSKKWKEKCIREGVPEVIFATKDARTNEMPPQLRVRATRVAGDGSTLARIMGLQELAPVVGSFGPKGVKEYQRQIVMATMGPEYVPAFVPQEEPDESAGGASLAGVENAVMRSGQSPIYSPDNEHRAHIAVHFALGNQTIQSLQQQQTNPVEADKVLSVLIPHMEEHINFVRQSPFEQQFFEQIRKPWDQLQEYAKLNRKNALEMLKKQVREQQEQAEKQQRVLSDEELKNLQVTNEEQRKGIKVRSQVDRAREANQTRAEVQREKVRLDAANDRLRINLESQNKGREEADKAVENLSLDEARKKISEINGATIAPSDIEAPVKRQ